ncbi:hypothetical protein NUW54_g2574 [Trametes sanguinea]|uniref:Uncharacterized protein n=1 Tax=Trametes sanguinea TaxID=158606 RepID=A0ACC1Q6B6_9APHY|nr:hypothetical protein NUW54_g2574 [Trametes sanguinea]
MSGEIPWKLVALAVLVVTLVRLITRKRLRHPPGPKGLPLLGNLFDLPKAYPEKTYAKLAKEYGDVVYLKVFGTSTVVLNSLEAARDLLDKRSSKYSDRPPMTLLVDLIGQTSSLIAIPYGDRLRKHRKWLHDGVGNKTQLASFQDIQRREARRLLHNLYDEPEHFREHLHLYLAAVMLEITYGKRVTSLDDEIVQMAERANESSNAAGYPTTWLLDYFPSLRHLPSWMPGAGFKKEAAMVRKYVKDWKDTAFEMIRAEMVAGKIAPCMFSTIFSEFGGSPTPEQAEEIKGLGFNVYNAGLETSRGTLLVFFLCMTRNPHVLRKAQEEIDRVVGKDRLPDFTDRESLPYVNALLEEVLRWNPGLPLPVPHRLMVDDEYRGYHLPAGSTVIANNWAITRDTRFFPDPEEFRPERYLVPKEQRDELLLPSSFLFGYGRRYAASPSHSLIIIHIRSPACRICPGQLLAVATVWLAVANIITLFDISKEIDELGNEITPPASFISGFTSQPAPFVCRIRPRSDRAAKMLSTIDHM